MNMPNPILSLAARAAQLLPLAVTRVVYRVTPIARILRGVLNKVAPHGYSEVEVAAGELIGLRLSLNLQTEKEYWLGTYEIELQKAVSDFITPGMVAYDVGANIGYVTLMLARAVGPHGKVISFEALPSNVERLRTNTALNHHLAQFDIQEQAVTDVSGKVQFLVHTSGGMGKVVGATGRQETYENKITVSTVSLDDFIYNEGNLPPDAVKMDIEGGEVLALPGMERLLAEKNPIIFLELHGFDAAHVAWEILTKYGYTLYKMDGKYNQINKLDELDWKAYVVGRRPK
jgi:FkbM family methyltransferase